MSTASTIRSVAAAVLAACVLCVSQSASAATCTVTGKLDIESVDNYYCDNNTADCTGWLAVDYDSTKKPLRYIRVRVVNPVYGNTIATGFTDGSGYYTVSWSASTACTSQYVRLEMDFIRVHESDRTVPLPRYRFRVVEYNSQATWYVVLSYITPSGATTTFNFTFLRASVPNSPGHKIANVYYTADAAVTEMSSWSSNLSSQLASTDSGVGGILRIAYDPIVGLAAPNADLAGWRVNLDGAQYRGGATTRHEIGHIAHYGMHHRSLASTCHSYRFNQDTSDTHNLRSCEYGASGMREALADFFALRSATATNQTAWLCLCENSTNQDLCSETTGATLPADAIAVCSGTTEVGWVGIGDPYTSGRTSCTRLMKDTAGSSGAGCTCPDTEPNRWCDGTSYQTHGWRNQVQVTRFLYDMIDSGNDGGDDDTDLSMSGFVAVLEGMGCTGTDYGVDGACNEPNRSSAGACNPANGAVPGLPMTGTRDAYNVWDFAAAIAGDQGSERTVNCVEGASD